ncbi:MAG: glycosyltransferase [Arenicellales bacterium]
MEKVSVIFVNYNSGRFLAESVLNLKSLSDNLEIVVIDNGSSDKSADYLRADSSVKLICVGENVGFGSAANIGARLAAGKYLLFLNPDAFPLPGTIAKMASHLDLASGCGTCGAFIVDFQGREQNGGRRSDPNLVRTLGKVASSVFSRLRFPTFDLTLDPLPTLPTPVDAVSGSCMMVRAEVHHEIGGFDEAFFLHFEDLDYCRRTRDAGWGVDFLPTAPAFHYQGGSVGVSRAIMAKHKQASLRRYLRKFSRSTPIVLSLQMSILLIFERVGLLMFRVSRNMRSETDGLASGIAQFRRIISGNQPVVLIMGGRSEIGAPLCGRLNAAGIAVVSVSRCEREAADFPRTSVVHPELFKRNLVANRLDIIGIVSLCPIWELQAYEQSFATLGCDRIPWIVFSSTSVLTRESEISSDPNGAVARLKSGEEWLMRRRRLSESRTLLARPTVIYGGKYNNNINLIKQIGRYTRLTPQLKFASGSRCPVHADDLAEWIVALLKIYTGDRDADLTTTEVQGGEVLTFREMVSRTSRSSGLTTRAITLSRNVFPFALFLVGRIPFLPKIPPKLVERLERDFVFDNREAQAQAPISMRFFHP